MVVTESIRNLDFPTVTDKEVTLDLEKAVTTESEGDEIYLLTATPGTTTTAAEGAVISPLLVDFFKSGYARSSGFKNPPFTISASNNQLQISIDGSSLRTITLDTGGGLTGNDVSDDLQNKINLLAADGGLEEGNLAFLNAIVSYENNKFVIISGSFSRSYTGSGKSSVSVSPGTTNDASVTLGFNVSVTSEAIASKLVSEAQVTGATSSSGSNDLIPVDDVSDLNVGDAFTIYNGTDRDYFIATSISGNYLVTHSGSVPLLTYSGGAIVQNIFERDPDAELASPYRSTDEVVRALLRAIAVQIDFSS